MAGHSKWANIRFKKGAKDAKRGKIFTKLIREITVASKMGGPDQDSNPRLRDAVTKALKANMKRDTIENAVKRGEKKDGEQLNEIVYEGYGPGGAAILVECFTDNKNRTVSEVRHAFSKHNGNLGSSGSVSYLFNKIGVITLNKEIDEDQILELVLDAGGDDIKRDSDGNLEINVSSEHYHNVLTSLNEQKFEPENSELTMISSQSQEVSPEQEEKLIKLLNVLEDLDDVQNVYTNASFESS